MGKGEKLVVWLVDVIGTPPYSVEARRDAGTLLGKVQCGVKLSLPFSRPMPSIGPRVHELRIDDGDVAWRIIYRADSEEIVVVESFKKKTQTTPKKVIVACKKRLREWDE